MYLECLIVSIDFGDFLEATLPYNRCLFDDVTIVTSPEDEQTQCLAQEHDCSIVTTTRHRETYLFNKSKVINDGLDWCSERGWLCLLDADIVLPKNFRTEVFRRIELIYPVKRRREGWVENTIFGLHRYMCWDKREWEDYLKTGKHQWELEKIRLRSQAPAGYFQLWNPKHRKERYPEEFPKEYAGVSPVCSPKFGTQGGYHGDLAFSRQFGHCRHLSTPKVIHLATKTESNNDYYGRVSSEW